MDLPFFFSDDLTQQSTTLFLDEAASRHAVQVLRMKESDALQIANGKGSIAKAIITNAHKKRTELNIEMVSFDPKAIHSIGIAISLVKNAARFEWFLEKATEIGVTDIYPLLCHRTERELFRLDRMKQILISAMLQSQQAWMPVLHTTATFTESIKYFEKIDGQKMIAHCLETDKKQLVDQLINESINRLILIGPEGDFTKEEIQLAMDNNYISVALGNTRLRTETAGMVAATLLKLV
ncbi:MAG: RsmE family RNA methyltransferase [Chitinophagaceae bacterium]